jgi:hypothetical protein
MEGPTHDRHRGEVPMLTYAAMRRLSHARVTSPTDGTRYSRWNPYPNVKGYDPYGHLEEAGKPGPFYR